MALQWGQDMSNQFSITPASPMAGMNLLFEGVGKRAEFEREKAEKGKLQAKRQEAAQIMQTGTPAEISDYAIKNPEIIPEMDKAIGFKSELTKQNMIESARRVLIGGEDPSTVAIERAETVINEGGDATQSMELANIAATNPEAARAEAEKVLALYDPTAFAQYQKLGAAPETKDTRTADIKNYEFAKKGGYKGSFLEFKTEGKGVTEKKPTANMQDWEFYNKLKKEDPAQATLFASKVGIEEAPEKAAFEFTEDEITRMADEYAETGKFPIPGRGGEIKKLNAKIKKKSLEQQKAKGVSDIATLYNRLDKKGMQKDIDGQQVKIGSMRSFIGNIDKQAAKIKEVGGRMKRFDTKLLNIPLNKVIDAVGDADRATFRLLIGEMSEEIGKLASGATNSVAALSEGGREKWDKIFDTNLSYNDMMKLVDESKEIAHMRVDSMKESLKESRKIIRKTPRTKQATPKYEEGQTANGGKLIFSGGVWKDNV